MEIEPKSILIAAILMFAMASIWNGSGLIADCLQSAAYQACKADELGTDPVVAGGVMVVVGAILMACITKPKKYPQKKIGGR